MSLGYYDYMGVRKETVVSFLRWIAVLPVSLAGATAASIVSAFVLPYWFAPGSPPESFLYKLVSVPLSSYAFGGVLVCLGAYIAPSHQRRVAIVFCALSGILVAPAILLGLTRSDYWTLLTGVCVLAGACSASFVICEGKAEHPQGH